MEKRIIFAEEAGQKWANLHEIWLQLKDDKENYLSALMLDLDDGSGMSDKKLERMARASKQFRDYCKNMNIAKGEELRARIRYDNARDYFEAGRSQESTEREKMKHLSSIP